MRIEELENNMYIKSTDSVEKFLLNIIQEYFKDSNEALEGSREYIIREAVDRLRTEMDYNSLGVLSVALPNGDVRKGDVHISLEDLGGEPLISPKLSAFNVNFGTTANTACEGNDPRLYDARLPLQHTHQIDDILGLSAALSSIGSKIDRIGANSHTHSNKSVLDKLTYSGTKTTIDLSVIDTLEPKIDNLMLELRTRISNYITDTNNKLNAINTEIERISSEIDSIHAYVIQKCEDYLRDAKQYIDQLIETSTQHFTDYLEENYVKKSSIPDLIDIARHCYTLVGSFEENIKTMIYQTSDMVREVKFPIPQYIIDELERRSLTLGNTEIIYKFYLKYTKGGITYKQPIPYCEAYHGAFAPFLYPLMKDLTISGFIQATKITEDINDENNNNVFKIVFINNESQLSEEIIQNGKIVCDMFARPTCPII